MFVQRIEPNCCVPSRVQHPTLLSRGHRAISSPDATPSPGSGSFPPAEESDAEPVDSPHLLLFQLRVQHTTLKRILDRALRTNCGWLHRVQDSFCVVPRTVILVLACARGWNPFKRRQTILPRAGQLRVTTEVVRFCATSYGVNRQKFTHAWRRRTRQPSTALASAHRLGDHSLALARCCRICRSLRLLRKDLTTRFQKCRPSRNARLSRHSTLCQNAKNVSGFGGIDPYPLAFRTTAGNRYCATVHRWPGLENPLL